MQICVREGNYAAAKQFQQDVQVSEKCQSRGGVIAQSQQHKHIFTGTYIPIGNYEAS